jgi:hypothetical protein
MQYNNPTKFLAGYRQHKQQTISSSEATTTKIITIQESEKTALRTTCIKETTSKKISDITTYKKITNDEHVCFPVIISAVTPNI